MQHAFGEADGDALTGIERAAHTGRRITARRARREKRTQHRSKRWSFGPLTVTPLVAAIVAVALVAGVAGAVAIASRAKSTTNGLARSSPVSGRSSTPATRLPTKVAPQAQSIFIRFADAGKTTHYMYCTQARGCDLIDVAKNGSSTIAALPIGNDWHRVERHVIRHDPCINTVQNGVRVGKPGDLVLVTTTDLRGVGTKVIKDIRVPAHIVGSIATHFQTPDQPGCSFSAFTDGARNVDSVVTEYVP